ncbi:MAG: 4Fe-4S dicluster domain-containing protein [Candidatus Nezhaarchaeota archaeon]|nr:4Fe-4S dicluster domain-containing protein [Candidatus Nezhaarchaeota archaeon]
MRREWVAAFQRPGIELVFDSSRCLGCLSCQVVCAHRFFKVVNTEGSGIRLLANELRDVKAKYCKQCSEPACLESCGVGAIYRVGGLVCIDYDSCTGCGACVSSCPFGLMFWFKEASLPVKCNLCGGSPLCVKLCPRGALGVVVRD